MNLMSFTLIVSSLLLTAPVFAAPKGTDLFIEGISTSPAAKEISAPGHLVGSSSGFIEFNDGTFGIFVRLRFQNGRPSDPAHFASAYFSLNQGSLVRDGNDLYWINRGNPLHVAHHEWWYSPAWSVSEGVRINDSVDRIHNGSGWETYNVSASLALSNGTSLTDIELATGASWVCMAKSTYGTHPATVVWSDDSSTRSEAEDSAMEKCKREAAAPMNCHVTDCWIHQDSDQAFPEGADHE